MGLSAGLAAVLSWALPEGWAGAARHVSRAAARAAQSVRARYPQVPPVDRLVWCGRRALFTTVTLFGKATRAGRTYILIFGIIGILSPTSQAPSAFFSDRLKSREFSTVPQR